VKFRLNEPFDETTADGRQVKSLMTLDSPNVLKHVMEGTAGGKDSTCWREFTADKMKCTCKVEDVVTVRHYDRAQ